MVNDEFPYISSYYRISDDKIVLRIRNIKSVDDINLESIVEWLRSKRVLAHNEFIKGEFWINKSQEDGAVEVKLTITHNTKQHGLNWEI